MNIKKNDTVLVIAGNDNGAKGRVLQVLPKKDKVIVENVAIMKKHVKPSQQNQQGGIVEKERPIQASNVMLVCPKCKEGTRVGFKVLEDGKKVRVCKKCNEMIS